MNSISFQVNELKADSVFPQLSHVTRFGSPRRACRVRQIGVPRTACRVRQIGVPRKKCRVSMSFLFF